MDMLRNILSQSVVHKLGWTLLHSLWQGGMVMLLLVVLLRVFRKSSANLRYVIACMGLAVIVLLPAITFYIIPEPVPTPEVESVPGFSDPAIERPYKVYDTDMPLHRAAEYMEISHTISLKQRAMNYYASALPYIVLGWFIGVLALSIWHVGGFIRLLRLKRQRVSLVDEFLKRKLLSLAERLKVARPVMLMESALVQIPTVVGWFRPVILLPASALTGLSPEQLEALLAHELAHIRRHDYLVNMFQTLVDILGFYHPAVWWISYTIRVERENCCDDLAVSVCGDKVGYARALASMEEARFSQGELAVAASGGNFSRRIHRLIGTGSEKNIRFGYWPVVVSILLVIALMIPTTLALTVKRDNKDSNSVSTKETDSTKTIDAGLVVKDQMNDFERDPVADLDETAAKAQILFECKICEVLADVKFLEGEQKEDKVGQMIWLGNEYAERLEALCRKSKKAKILANPRILVLEGEEGNIAVGEEIPYKSGYESTTEGGTEPKPIVKYTFDGIDLKLKGHTVDGNTIYTELRLTKSKTGLTTHNDDQGREIQFPVVTSSICATEVTVLSQTPVVIGGLKSQDNYNSQLLLVITPSIYLPEKDIEGQVNITKERPDAKSVELQPIESIKTGPQTQLERNEITVRYEKQEKDLEQQTTELQKLHENIQKQLEDLEKRKAELESLRNVLALAKEVESGEVPRYHTVREGETLSSISEKYYGSENKWQEILNYNPEIKTSDGIRVGQKLILPPLRASTKEPRSERERLAAMAAKFAERGDFTKAIEHLENAIELAKAEKNYGIGLAIEKADGLIRISQILPDTPASGSSFKKGDIIEAVDGVSTEGMSLNEVVAAIRGPKGTKVTLTVKSQSQDITMEETFTRQLPLKGSPALREYFWRLDAYEADKTWPQYREMMKYYKPWPEGTVRIFELKYVNPEELAQLLNRILQRRWKGIKDRPKDSVRIVPDPGHKKLIIHASPADIQLIEALIAELDVLAKRDTAVLKAARDTEYKQDPPAGSTITQVIKLKHADCKDVEQILRELLSNRQFRIATDERTNMLIVVGTKSAIEEIEALVTELDVPGSGTNREALDTYKQEKVDSDLIPSLTVE